MGPDQTRGEILSAHWSFATIPVGRRWAAGGRADAHYQRRYTSGGTSTQVQFCLERENASEGIRRFFTWIVGIALVIAAVIFLLPPAISAFENARLVWQLVIIAAVAVGFIVAAIGRAARYIRERMTQHRRAHGPPRCRRTR